MNLSRIKNALCELSYKKIRYVFIIISGLLTGLTLVVPTIGFIEWITLIPVATVILGKASDKTVRLRSLYLDGFVFYYSFYIVCFFWFTYLYPLDFVDGMTKGAALAVVIIAWFGLSLLQALLSAFCFVFIGIAFRGGICEKVGMLKPLVAAGVWAVIEWTQTIGWWGVPWGRLPLGQIKYVVGVQNASWFGSYIITFMLVAVNFLLAYALLNTEKFKVSVIIAASLLVFQYGSGALIYFTTDVNDGEKIRVACVQGNISSSEKWDKSSLSKTLDVYTRYTVSAAEQGAQIVIWPETAFPYDIGDDSSYGKYFEELSKEQKVYILVGAYVCDENGAPLNSLICFTPEGERLDTVYSKRHLVPFGEYVPLRPVIQTLIPPLAELVLSDEDIVPGEGAQIIEIGEGIALGGLICFDSIYEELTLESVRAGAELICLSTNDSWFIDSVALDMHNAQAQLRAIESGRYVARAANTGISTVITPRGEVVDSLGALVDGVIVEDVYATDRVTLWSIVGNGFVYLLIVIYLFLLGERIWITINKKYKINKNT